MSLEYLFSYLEKMVVFGTTSVINKVHKCEGIVTVSIDPLAQVLIKPMGEFGVILLLDAQRFGYYCMWWTTRSIFATKEIYKRQIPGRIVGQSVDVEQSSFELALQTKATYSEG